MNQVNPTQKIYKNNKLPKIKAAPLILIFVAFLAGIGGGVAADRMFPERLTSLNTTATQQKIVSSQSQLIASIAKDVSPSVVSINVKGSQNVGGLNYFFGNGGNSVPTEGAGTGIILSSDGVIVTNKHVIPTSTTSVSVTTNDGKTYDNVEVIARDPRSNFDIAFLKIKDVNSLKPAKLGDSANMQVGDSVIAIGYALGQYQNTVTTGIISGLNRPVTAGDSSGTGASESLTNLFQTDAAINPGNSGGPLLNMNGEVIGINTALAGNAQNIGFSIPINDVQPQIASILKDGKLQVPYLGVRYVVLNQSLKDAYNLSTDQGAWLKSSDSNQAVVNGSPADKAGLKEGDIVTKINNNPVNTDNTLASILTKYKVGEKIAITYIRDGETHTTETEMSLAPNN